jgi:hypothetical protein
MSASSLPCNILNKIYIILSKLCFKTLVIHGFPPYICHTHTKQLAKVLFRNTEGRTGGPYNIMYYSMFLIIPTSSLHYSRQYAMDKTYLLMRESLLLMVLLARHCLSGCCSDRCYRSCRLHIHILILIWWWVGHSTRMVPSYPWHRLQNNNYIRRLLFHLLSQLDYKEK